MSLLSVMSGRLSAGLVSVALALPLWSAPAHADVLSIVDTTTQLVLDPAAAEFFDRGFFAFEGTGLWSNISGVLNAPVESVTVDGQGPGPIEVHWTQDLRLITSDVPTDAYNLRNFVLSVADQVVYVDATFSPYIDQPGQLFTRLPLFSLQNLSGDVDGVSLLQAVSSPTLAVQQVRLNASIYLNPEAAYLMLSAFTSDVPQPNEWPVMYAGELSIQPVPEPATWALMGLGLIGVMAVASRRRRIS